MRRFQCHKQVMASVITEFVWPATPGNNISLGLTDGFSISVTDEWFKKHNPELGGVFVMYDDGYKSYSPRKTFESGYTPLNSNQEG